MDSTRICFMGVINNRSTLNLSRRCDYVNLEEILHDTLGVKSSYNTAAATATGVQKTKIVRAYVYNRSCLGQSKYSGFNKNYRYYFVFCSPRCLVHFVPGKVGTEKKIELALVAQWSSPLSREFVPLGLQQP